MSQLTKEEKAEKLRKLMEELEIEPDEVLEMLHPDISKASQEFVGTPATTLRPYQRDLVKRVLEVSNSIVTLPTGTGKTEIAFAVAYEAKKKYPNSIVVFLCPTTVLVQQQARRYESTFDTRSCCLTGGKALISSLDVFATPASFRGHIRDGSLRFSEISLLVIDECHHAVMRWSQKNYTETDHEYRHVLDEYRKQLPFERPKLVGLTASPGEIEEEMMNLCKKFQGQLLTVKVDPKDNPVPKLKILNIPERHGRDGEDWNTILNHLAEYQKKYQRDTKNPDISKRKIGQVQDLRGYVRLIGVDPGFHDLEEQYRDKSASTAEDGSRIFREMVREVLRIQDAYISPFLMELETLLQKTSGQKIVFVPTARVAICVAQLLNRLEYCRAEFLVGGTSNFSTDAMNMERMRKFRQGEYDVLVATSVLEEGIDVPKCSLVVRTEPPTTVISNIQARGRARYPKSKYIILTANEKEHRQALDMNAKESKLPDLIEQIEAKTADLIPFPTSWNTATSPSRSTSASSTAAAARPKNSTPANSFDETVNFVSRLNEFCQARGISPATYKKIRTGGQDHQPLFRAEVTVGTKKFVSPTDTNNFKTAKKRAAFEACKALKAYP